jgi:hypothetical protein
VQEPEDLIPASPPPGAELEPPVGKVVHHRNPLGHLDRVVHLGQRVEDARADVDALRGVSQIAQHHVAGRDVRVLVQEVVLGDPHVFEA